VVAGTVAIGFLGLLGQLRLNTLFGIPDSFARKAWIAAPGRALYDFAMKELNRGIQLLSKDQRDLSPLACRSQCWFRPTVFIFKRLLSRPWLLLGTSFGMAALSRRAGLFGGTGWLGLVDGVLLGWFMGLRPLMASHRACLREGGRSSRSS